IGRKVQPLLKVFQENVHIFAGRDAPEKNDVAVSGQIFGETPDGFLERFPVARILLVDVDLAELAQVSQRDLSPYGDQSACRCDDERSEFAISIAGKHICVGNFTTKIETAQKCEYFGDGRSTAAPQFLCDIELGALAQDHLGAPAAGVGWG